MLKQRRKAFWSLIGISTLFTLLLGGIGIYPSFKGSGGSTASAAPQIVAPTGETHPWTAVASTGTVDESSMPHVEFGLPPVGGSAAGYKIGSLEFITPIVLRYNVTNTFDNNPANPNIPNWSTLQLGSFAPPTSDVRATLYRVRICNGFQEEICTAINQGEGFGCDTCKADALGPIDFGNYLYYVEVKLSRATYLPHPRAHTLRLY